MHNNDEVVAMRHKKPFSFILHLLHVKIWLQIAVKKFIFTFTFHILCVMVVQVFHFAFCFRFVCVCEISPHVLCVCERQVYIFFISIKSTPHFLCMHAINSRLLTDSSMKCFDIAMRTWKWKKLPQKRERLCL
jgi:hypothetical protein